MLALAASVLVTVSIGLLIAGGARTSCVTGKGEGPCPAPLVGPDGTAVRDKYYFVHQPLTGNGSITARVSDLIGQLRMPDAVPGVRNVKQGVVPWAKAGLLVRQSLRQGTPYAAVMLTGEHGVRMQYNYVHDVPGGPHNGPQWLRLTRSGDLVTGYESDDGARWTQIGAVRLGDLPETVEIGLFATSPGVLWDTAAAFSQVTATFDRIGLEGANGSWRYDDVGVSMESDGTTPHHPGRAVASGDKLIVTGGGDIGPATAEGGLRADLMLIGGAVGLIPVLMASVTFVTAGNRRGLSGAGLSGAGAAGDGLSARPIGAEPAGRAEVARLLVAKAVVAGAVAFVVGLVAAGVVCSGRSGAVACQPQPDPADHPGHRAAGDRGLRGTQRRRCRTGARPGRAAQAGRRRRRAGHRAGRRTPPADRRGPGAMAADGHPCRRVRDHAERSCVRARGRRPVAARRLLPAPAMGGSGSDVRICRLRPGGGHPGHTRGPACPARHCQRPSCLTQVCVTGIRNVTRSPSR
ncbi:hypothetical protein GCM10020220_046930 [Nonomuraea rubra]